MYINILLPFPHWQWVVNVIRIEQYVVYALRKILFHHFRILESESVNIYICTIKRPLKPELKQNVYFLMFKFVLLFMKLNSLHTSWIFRELIRWAYTCSHLFLLRSFKCGQIPSLSRKLKNCCLTQSYHYLGIYFDSAWKFIKQRFKTKYNAVLFLISSSWKGVMVQ